MTQPTLNFARNSSWRWLTLLCLVAGVVGSLHALWRREALLARMDEQQQLIHRLERSLSRAERRAASTMKRDPTAATHIRALAGELQRPWEAMLDSLQRAARADMVLTRLQPEAQGERLLVSGQADSSAAFLDYLTRLRKDRRWAQVLPVSEEAAAATMAPGSKPLAFQLAAEWKAAP